MVIQVLAVLGDGSRDGVGGWNDGVLDLALQV